MTGKPSMVEAQLPITQHNAAGSRRSASRQLPWLICVLGTMLLVPGLSLLILNRDAFEIWSITNVPGLFGGVVYLVIGALIATRRPHNRIGWLFLSLGMCTNLAGLAAQWGVYGLVTNPGMTGGAIAIWSSLWISATVLALTPTLVLLLFPSGRLVGRFPKTVAALAGIATILLLAFLTSGESAPPGFPTLFDETPNPLARETPLGDPGLMIMVIGLCGLTSIGLLLQRFRRSSGERRKQYTWVMLAMALIVAAFIVDFVARATNSGLHPVTGPTLSLSLALLPVSMGIAILRHRLWDVDVVISRAIVYLVLTACIVAIYVFIVGWLGATFRTDSNLFFSLLATGIVAILFQPLRDATQRRVNRMLFGQRDEPYDVMSRLGQQIESTYDPDGVLPAITSTIRDALKLPYVAIVLPQQPESLPAASSGAPVADLMTIPLMYQQSQVGELLLGQRSSGDPFSPADRRLLYDLARQAGIAVHAVGLAQDLQATRERLVETREEERRRLRRDLHDGLGSQLAALSLQTSALRTLIDNDPGAAKAEATEIRSQLQEAVSSIRTLVHDLRPPAIDELGLFMALEERTRQYRGEKLVIDTHLPGIAPALPAAIEVAIYRIIEEALANVVKHSHATHALVQLTIDDAVHLSITDNGTGISPDARPGVGFFSLHERANELGGTCQISSSPNGGTTVDTRLPLGKARANGR
jgi:two-component system, NarL family, sensor kinase